MVQGSVEDIQGYPPLRTLSKCESTAPATPMQAHLCSPLGVSKQVKFSCAIERDGIKVRMIDSVRRVARISPSSSQRFRERMLPLVSMFKSQRQRDSQHHGPVRLTLKANVRRARSKSPLCATSGPQAAAVSGFWRMMTPCWPQILRLAIWRSG